MDLTPDSRTGGYGYSDGYMVTSVPVTVGTTRQRSFCSDASGVIRFNTAGTVNAGPSLNCATGDSQLRSKPVATRRGRASLHSRRVEGADIVMQSSDALGRREDRARLSINVGRSKCRTVRANGARTKSNSHYRLTLG
jgi:hypothetical protein